MSRRQVWFRAIPTLCCAAIVGTLFWLHFDSDPTALSRRAWRASYEERGLAVPGEGPRAGYWGSRLLPKQRDQVLGWRDTPLLLDGLIAVDARGMQHFDAAPRSAQRVVILGGSVAWGTYASAIDKTYFHMLGRELQARGVPADITVIAAGAWKSDQELRAIEHFGDVIERADLVVLLNGLNDLTNGARFDTLFNEPVTPRDGSAFRAEYHEHDYAERVDHYLRNMSAAWDRTSPQGVALLVALQPSLTERAPPSAIERELVVRSMVEHESADALVRSYAAMRRGLARLTRRPDFHVADASRSLNLDPETTFADLWHFSDPGHAQLAAFLADPIAALLRARRHVVASRATHGSVRMNRDAPARVE